MTYNREDIERFSEGDVRRINEALVTRELITPNNYYIDLQLVKDLHVGAVLIALKRLSEEERRVVYNTVFENIKNYQLRRFDELSSLLVNTPITKEEVTDILYDPTYAGMLLKLSPVTGFINLLDTHLKINNNHSHVKEKFTKVSVSTTQYVKAWEAITLNINHYPLRLSDTDQLLLVAFFMDRYGVNIKLHYIEPFNMPYALFAQMDESHVYRMDHFFESPEISKEFKALGYLDKHLFVTPLLPPERRSLISDDHIKKELGTLQAYFNCAISFSFHQPRAYGARPDILMPPPLPEQ